MSLAGMVWAAQMAALPFWNGAGEQSLQWFSERLEQMAGKDYPAGARASEEAAFLVPGASWRDSPSDLIGRRLRGSGTTFSIPSSDQAEYLIRSLLSGQRGQAELLLALRAQYFPFLQQQLSENELPTELKYLAMAASALNPGGRFSDGRAGLWGFSAPTARFYGLRIDSHLDERLDVERSTEAAMQRLKDLQAALGDWSLVIAAHGGGPAALQRAIQREGGNGQIDRLARHLPPQARALLDAFAASFYLDRYHADHGLHPADLQFPAEVAAVSVERPLGLKEAAKLLDTSLDTLTALNPQWLQGRIFPFEGDARLRLPAREAERFPQILSALPPSPSPEAPSPPLDSLTVEDALAWRDSYKVTVYRVRPGDSLGRISNRFGVSIAEIRRWNGLGSNLIIAGQELEIRAPDRAAVPQRAASSRPSAPSEEPKGLELHWHRVRSGDTLGQIAERYQVRTSSLRRWNGLRGDLIYAGQRLKVYLPPGQSASSEESTAKIRPAHGTSRYHTIRPGDTLWSIARLYPGVSADELKRFNHLSDERSLRPGMRLRIPETE